MDENPACLTQKTDEPKCNKGTFTHTHKHTHTHTHARAHTHTHTHRVNAIEL